MKRIFSFTMILILVISFGIPQVMAENETMKKEKEINKIIDKQRKEYQKQGKLSKDQIDKALESQIILENEIYDNLLADDYNASLFESFAATEYIKAAPIPTYDINSYIYGQKAANEYKWDDGGNYAKAIMHSGANKDILYTHSSVPIVGSSSGYAWTGYRFKFTGSGKSNKVVLFEGLSGLIECKSIGLGSSSSATLSIRLFDATTGTYMFTESINSVTTVESEYSQLVVSKSFYRSDFYEFVAGHEYVAFFILLSNTGGVGTVGQSYTDQGTQWGSLTIN